MKDIGCKLLPDGYLSYFLYGNNFVTGILCYIHVHHVNVQKTITSKCRYRILHVLIENQLRYMSNQDQPINY